MKFDQLYFKDKADFVKNTSKKHSTNVVDYLKLDVQTKIDLRGMRVDEALKSLDKFISEAILTNVGYITIIHGKGTGALRSSIHDYLSEVKEIKFFRLGELVEGGAGVTVVYF